MTTASTRVASRGKARRERSGNDDAKLILLGHSMGGLVSRYFLELHEGWKLTRLLITFGTPYRGSLNALNFIVNGLRKRVGPVTLANLTQLVRSFTSTYQLLPVYPCIDPGDGELKRITEVAGVPGLVGERAANALAFHRAISSAVEEHCNDAAYRDERYKIRPVSGIFQPTFQSGVLQGDGLKMLRSYRGADQGGDGTVPSVSATPLELSNQDLEFYVRDRHASIQNADTSIDQVIGLLRRQRIDQAQVFEPGSSVSLDIEDAYLVGEPICVRALAEAQWATLTATIEDADTGAIVESAALRTDGDGWQTAEMHPLPQGAYRVTVRGNEAGVSPVADVFAVFDEQLSAEI